jgi:hypothetical protein
MLAWLVTFSFHPRRAAPCRHVTKNPSPQLLLSCALTNRDARNSFRIRSYANCRVSPAFLLDVSGFPTCRVHISPLSATLMNIPASVANKRLAELTKPFRCKTYKKPGGTPALFPDFRSDQACSADSAPLRFGSTSSMQPPARSTGHKAKLRPLRASRPLRLCVIFFRLRSFNFQLSTVNLLCAALPRSTGHGTRLTSQPSQCYHLEETWN